MNSNVDSFFFDWKRENVYWYHRCVVSSHSHNTEEIQNTEKLIGLWSVRDDDTFNEMRGLIFTFETWIVVNNSAEHCAGLLAVHSSISFAAAGGWWKYLWSTQITWFGFLLPINYICPALQLWQTNIISIPRFSKAPLWLRGMNE